MIRPGTGPTGLRVLVAEDDADTAVSTAALLSLSGHEVDIAADGPFAVEAVVTGHPDVVLLDISLPGLDGYEVAKRVKGQHAERTPLLIAVTGYGSAEDRQRSAAAGIDLHLVKPVDPELLQKLLKRFQQVVG
jgi:two-component system CheB/CheR fusion protein